VEQYHPQQKKSIQMFIHSTTSLRNKTIYDPFVNMLRTTTEGMSAAIGNSDSISIAPFNLAFTDPDDFSVRIARNQQLILKEEAYLDKIIDPSAGSYFIEHLTHSFVVHAWDLFLKIEDKGGFIECIKSGFIQNEIEASCRKKENDIATRKMIMIGTNQYPNLKESMLDKVVKQPAKTNQEPSAKYQKLNLTRSGQPFEMLRLALEKFVASGKKKPSVYLLTFGNLNMRKARATFATNFFGCAGYEILEDETFSTVEEGVKASLEAKAEIIVICSSDEEYATIAPFVAEEIKKVDPAIKVIVAGYPKKILETLKLAGVDDFIHFRSNLIETLTKFHEMMGII
jgi:methylmalonyl-CoA mutase